MTSDLLKLAPTMLSASLLADNYSFVKKDKKDFIGQGLKNIVGVSLIKEISSL